LVVTQWGLEFILGGKKGKALFNWGIKFNYGTIIWETTGAFALGKMVSLPGMVVPRALFQESPLALLKI